MSRMKNDQITVVIPTVGEESLNQVLESLSLGSVIPGRILICIPQDSICKNVQRLVDLYATVEIVATKERGQVHQRLVGFLKSKSKYTLQLDSDVIVDKELLSELIKRMEKHSDIAVGPIIIDHLTNRERSYLSPNSSEFSNLELKILYRISNGKDGFKTGMISKSGINFGLEDYSINQEVEWLPGGCVMHETKNLILENFYPYDGKAYAEDLYHSMALVQNGIKLVVANNAKVRIKFIKLKPKDVSYFLKEQFLYMRAMLNLISLYKKNKVRFVLFRLVILAFNFKKKMLS